MQQQKLSPRLSLAHWPCLTHLVDSNLGEDLQLTFDTLIGTGMNANVAAVVVIGIEPKWTQRVADGNR
jgi:altronate dehydratase